MSCYPNSTYDFCNFLLDIKQAAVTTLLHIMLIPVLAIIVLSILDREKEDAKWFIFNSAVIYFILAILWKIMLIQSNSLIYQMWFMTRDLAQYSLFPLAATRILYLYFPNYARVVFNKKKQLFFLMLSYDFFMLGLIFAYYPYYYLFLALPLYIFILIFTFLATFGCSLLVLYKIHEMTKLVVVGHELSQLYDLRRAALVCVFQSSFYLIYILAVLYQKTHELFLQGSSYTFDAVYQVVHDGKDILYLFVIILDTLPPLILLRTYRKSMKIWYTYVIETKKDSSFSSFLSCSATNK